MKKGKIFNEIVNLDASKSCQKTNIPNILPKEILTSFLRLLTKESPIQVFSVNIAKFLKTSILKKSSKFKTQLRVNMYIKKYF